MKNIFGIEKLVGKIRNTGIFNILTSGKKTGGKIDSDSDFKSILKTSNEKYQNFNSSFGTGKTTTADPENRSLGIITVPSKTQFIPSMEILQKNIQTQSLNEAKIQQSHETVAQNIHLVSSVTNPLMQMQANNAALESMDVPLQPTAITENSTLLFSGSEQPVPVEGKMAPETKHSIPVKFGKAVSINNAKLTFSKLSQPVSNESAKLASGEFVKPAAVESTTNTLVESVIPASIESAKAVSGELEKPAAVESEKQISSESPQSALDKVVKPAGKLKKLLNFFLYGHSEIGQVVDSTKPVKHNNNNSVTLKNTWQTGAPGFNETYPEKMTNSNTTKIPNVELDNEIYVEKPLSSAHSPAPKQPTSTHKHSVGNKSDADQPLSKVTSEQIDDNFTDRKQQVNFDADSVLELENLSVATTLARKVNGTRNVNVKSFQETLVSTGKINKNALLTALINAQNKTDMERNFVSVKPANVTTPLTTDSSEKQPVTSKVKELLQTRPTSRPIQASSSNMMESNRNVFAKSDPAVPKEQTIDSFPLATPSIKSKSINDAKPGNRLEPEKEQRLFNLEEDQQIQNSVTQNIKSKTTRQSVRAQNFNPVIPSRSVNDLGADLKVVKNMTRSTDPLTRQDVQELQFNKQIDDTSKDVPSKKVTPESVTRPDPNNGAASVTGKKLNINPQSAMSVNANNQVDSDDMVNTMKTTANKTVTINRQNDSSSLVETESQQKNTQDQVSPNSVRSSVNYTPDVIKTTTQKSASETIKFVAMANNSANADSINKSVSAKNKQEPIVGANIHKTKQVNPGSTVNSDQQTRSVEKLAGMKVDHLQPNPEIVKIPYQSSKQPERVERSFDSIKKPAIQSNIDELKMPRQINNDSTQVITTTEKKTVGSNNLTFNNNVEIKTTGTVEHSNTPVKVLEQQNTLNRLADDSKPVIPSQTSILMSNEHQPGKTVPTIKAADDPKVINTKPIMPDTDAPRVVSVSHSNNTNSLDVTKLPGKGDTIPEKNVLEVKRSDIATPVNIKASIRVPDNAPGIADKKSAIPVTDNTSASSTPQVQNNSSKPARSVIDQEVTRIKADVQSVTLNSRYADKTLTAVIGNNTGNRTMKMVNSLLYGTKNALGKIKESNVLPEKNVQSFSDKQMVASNNKSDNINEINKSSGSKSKIIINGTLTVNSVHEQQDSDTQHQNSAPQKVDNRDLQQEKLIVSTTNKKDLKITQQPKQVVTNLTETTITKKTELASNDDEKFWHASISEKTSTTASKSNKQVLQNQKETNNDIQASQNSGQTTGAKGENKIATAETRPADFDFTSRNEFIRNDDKVTTPGNKAQDLSGTDGKTKAVKQDTSVQYTELASKTASVNVETREKNMNSTNNSANVSRSEVQESSTIMNNSGNNRNNTDAETGHLKDGGYVKNAEDAGSIKTETASFARQIEQAVNNSLSTQQSVQLKPAELVQLTTRIHEGLMSLATQSKEEKLILRTDITDLGSLQIELTNKDDKIQVILRVNTETARQALEQNLSDLKQNLAKQDVAANNIQIVVSDHQGREAGNRERMLSRNRKDTRKEEKITEADLSTSHLQPGVKYKSQWSTYETIA